MSHSKNSGGFVAGTLIHTETGLKPIEQIQVGDFVLSKSEIGGQIYKRVLRTFAHEPTRVVNVKYEYYEGEERKFAQVTTTLNHPFWVVDKGWTEAKNLEPKWTKQLACIKKKVELCDARHVTIFYVEPIYISEQLGIGWHCSSPGNIQGFGYLWDYVNHQKVAEKVYAPSKIRFDSNGSAYGEERGSNRGHPHTHYLTLPVYNLEVENFHTYFVGEHGVLVHDAIQQTS